MTDSQKPDDFAAQQAILQARQREAREREVAFRLAQEKEMERLLSGHFGVQTRPPPRPEPSAQAVPSQHGRPPPAPTAQPPVPPQPEERDHMRPPPKPGSGPGAPPAAPAAPAAPPAVPAAPSPQPAPQAKLESEGVRDMSGIDRGDTLVHQISGTAERGLLYVSTGTSILDAVRFLASRKIGLALVCDPEGSLAGVLSERDVIRSIAARGAEILTMTVDPFITTDVVTCRSMDRVVDVAQMMSARRIRHVPIVDDGILKGMISATDIINFYAMTEGAPDNAWE